MSDSSETLGGVNPADLWMKWYESSSRMWTDALRGAQEGQADPWGLYRQWTESMEEARKSISGGSGSAASPEAAKSVEAMMGAMGGAMDPERTRKWFEETMRLLAEVRRVRDERDEPGPAFGCRSWSRPATT